MHPDVQDDPAGPPDRVRMHVEAEVRGGVEPLLPHHLLRIHPPAFDELGRIREEARERWMGVRHRELEMMSGVRLVNARIADRAEVVLPHRVRVVSDRRRHDVDPLRVQIELRR